jgi:hypothetical protein
MAGSLFRPIRGRAEESENSEASELPGHFRTRLILHFQWN